MQESTTQEGSADARGGPLSPGKAFVIALLLLAAALTGWMLSRPNSPTPPPTTNNEPTEPNYTLTNEEAIARFEELGALAVEAGRTRDTSLLAEVFDPTGPTYARAKKTIAELSRDNVIDKSRFKSSSVAVVTNTAQAIELREERIIYPCFVTESGENVTRNETPVRQVVIWTLVEVDSEWLIHDGVYKSAARLKKEGNRCA